MPNYALILNGVVTNTIIADDQETANLFGHAIEYDLENPAYIGESYDAETGKFAKPLPPVFVLPEGSTDPVAPTN